MPDSFSIAAKRARAQIAVPSFDMRELRQRSNAAGLRARVRALVAAIVVAFGGAGIVAAFANIGGGVHVWLFGDTVKATVQSFVTIKEPTASDINAVVARAAFPVILPGAVPHGWHVHGIAYSPSAHPTFFTIQLRDAEQKRRTSISILAASALASDANLLPGGPQTGTVTQGVHWNVGRETVLVQGHGFSDAAIAHLKSSMARQSRETNMAAFDALLPRFVVLQVAPRVDDVAARYATSRDDVLVGTWDLRQIPSIAAHGKPLHDPRTVYLTDIPQVKGDPDFRNAQLWWPKKTILSAAGVRAVASVLRRTHTGGDCRCAILVHHSAGVYTMWKISETTLTATRL